MRGRMEHGNRPGGQPPVRFKIGRRSPRAARAAFGVLAAGAAVLLAACSSSSSSNAAAGSTSAGAATSSTSATSTAAGVSALMADVNKYAATPSFGDYGPSYGGKVPSIANLAGKKIMIIPGVSALAACEEIAQAASNFDNQGTTAEHNTAIENAIHRGYAAIVMGCAMDPSTSAPAIAQAEKAGIVVGTYGGTPDMDQ